MTRSTISTISTTIPSHRSKTLVIIALALVAQSLGNVFLTRGMKSVGVLSISSVNRISDILETGGKIFANGSIWMGIAGLTLFFLLYLVALSWADLSYVLAVSSIGYVLNALMACWVLGESLSVLRWAGTLVICAGVILVSPTPPLTTGDPLPPDAP